MLHSIYTERDYANKYHNLLIFIKIRYVAQLGNLSGWWVMPALLKRAGIRS